MAVNIKTKGGMTSEEWAARQQLAACYRVFAMLGWDEMIYNHITLKVPGEDKAFLINPYGLHYTEVKASNLVKIDLDGNLLAPSAWGANKAGLVQHSVFHRSRPDAHCIMHTHTTAGMAVSAMQGGLRSTSIYASSFIGEIAYHDFEGVTVRPEEGERLVANIGQKWSMLLRNHGIIVLGRTLPEAFLRHWSLQRACEVQVAMASMGEAIEVTEETLAVNRRDLPQAMAPGNAGVADFEAMVRLVDRVDTSWRE